MRILVINGPNLNLLGDREPEIYGASSLVDLEKELRSSFPDIMIEFVQSNHEGEIIDQLQRAARESIDGVVMNPAGYSHTSVAIRDAILAIRVPVVEVHLSNIHAREPFRHRSMTAGAAVGMISGLGKAGYHLAIRYLIEADRS